MERRRPNETLPNMSQQDCAITKTVVLGRQVLQEPSGLTAMNLRSERMLIDGYQ